MVLDDMICYTRPTWAQYSRWLWYGHRTHSVSMSQSL